MKSFEPPYRQGRPLRDVTNTVHQFQRSSSLDQADSVQSQSPCSFVDKLTEKVTESASSASDQRTRGSKDQLSEDSTVSLAELHFQLSEPQPTFPAHDTPDLLAGAQQDAQESSDQGNSDKEFLDTRIKQLVDEIIKDLNSKANAKIGEKKSSENNVKDALKKLSFHEKCNKNAKLFQEHIHEKIVDNKATIFSCKTCQSFPKTINKIKASRHAISHSLPRKRVRENSLVYECAFCDEIFGTKKDHVKHYQENHCVNGKSILTCTKCFKDFVDLPSLSNHIRLNHRELKAKHENEMCSECGKSFETRKLLLRHTKKVHQDEKSSKCCICDRTFRDNYGLKRHMKRHKIVDVVSGTKMVGNDQSLPSNQVPCPLCNKTVKKINRHLRISHGVDKDLKPTFNQLKYQCEVCGKPFRDNCNLARHARSCVSKEATASDCIICGKCFSSKNNMKKHIKEVHKATRTCEKCKSHFLDKQDFYNHLPCQYKCKCGKKFPSLWRFKRHQESCDGSQKKSSQMEASKTEYHNVISFQCFICQLSDITSAELKNHFEECHGHISLTEPIRCESCAATVGNLLDHISHKHGSVRRLRKSYVKNQPDPMSSRPQVVFAIKSRPVEEEISVIENGDEDLSFGSGLDTGAALVSQDGISVNTNQHSGTLVSLEGEMDSTETFPVLLFNDVEEFGAPAGLKLVESVDTVPEVNKDDNESITLALDSDSDVDGGDNIDLEICLAVESIDERKTNLKLEILDRAIEEGIKASQLDDKLMENRMKALKDSIRNKERDRDASKSRAGVLNEIKLEEIKFLAEKSLNHIDGIENNVITSKRKQLYFSTFGERQSLFFRQIWDPFTDEQYEVVVDVLTAWHRSREENDDHYMKNVTLPELFVQIYKEIFSISTFEEAEVSIFNTPVD